MRAFWLLLFCVISALFCPVASAEFTAIDTPSDGGGSVTLCWSAYDFVGSSAADTLTIYRRNVGSIAWKLIAVAALSDESHLDDSVADGKPYEYMIVARGGDSSSNLYAGPVSASAQWYNAHRTTVLIGTLVCVLTLVAVTLLSRRNKPFYIRPIKGLEAVDEAVGRATEMGKPVLFTPGWGGDIQRPTTIAALNILRYVAAKTAEYRCDLYFPTHDPVIMAAAEEVVRESYIEQGQADMYNADNVFYTSSSQLGYAAAVDGVVSRYKPAAIFLLGTFEGEALILAETGNSVGAMQVAGTDSTIQLSFFMVACDFTLIGEELFAASGYLTKDAKILSSVKVQDFLKIAIVALLFAGAIMVTFGSNTLAEWIGRT
ncbi:MAG: hypothetical protein KKG33_08290 [candidate division Zixibacteria bacterium]|nr:hypothetical protein [candidate division Zixibacteria bacterium]